VCVRAREHLKGICVSQWRDQWYSSDTTPSSVYSINHNLPSFFSCLFLTLSNSLLTLSVKQVTPLSQTVTHTGRYQGMVACWGHIKQASSPETQWFQYAPPHCSVYQRRGATLFLELLTFMSCAFWFINT